MRSLGWVLAALLSTGCGSVGAGAEGRGGDGGGGGGDGGTGGSGGNSPPDFFTPFCAVEDPAPLFCPPAEDCAGETGHGLSWVSDMAFDRQANVYLVGPRGADGEGERPYRVSWFDGEAWHLLPPFVSPGWRPEVVSASGPSDVWIGGIDRVARWDGGSGWTAFELPGEWIFALAVDRPDRAFASSTGGLLRFDGAAWSVVDDHLDGSGWWSTLRLRGNGVERANGGSFDYWEDGVTVPQDVRGLVVRAPAGADGWATADCAAAELRDGAWVRHSLVEDVACPLEDVLDSVAVFRGSPIVSDATGLHVVRDDRKFGLGLPPELDATAVEGSYRAHVHALSTGVDLWVQDDRVATVWRLGNECWEAHRPAAF